MDIIVSGRLCSVVPGIMPDFHGAFTTLVYIPPFVLGSSGILMGKSPAFSYSASRYSYSYSKTFESMQGDHLFKEAETPVFGPYVNYIQTSPFEHEYRFTEYEYEYE